MIKNILFDLGGVLLRLDMDKTREAFAQLGWKKENWEDVSLSDNPVFKNLEIGLDSPSQFREKIRRILPGNPSDHEIEVAWCAMLIDFPTGIIDYLIRLKGKYRLYLLSNTNELHVRRFEHIFENAYGYPISSLFEKCYYSNEIGFRKPNVEAFLAVLKDASINPAETLFVDDLQHNTDAAKTLGMKVLHIEAGTLMERLPEYLENAAG